MSTDVSIIIVNFNTGHLLRDCVQSVKEKTDGVSYEIIVVDNASSDGSLGLMEAGHPEVTTLRCRENRGFGKGNNLGMQAATGKYFFLLNPDTLLINNAVKILFEFMERAENSLIGVCGAALYDAGGGPATSYGGFPTPWSMLFYSIPPTAMFRDNRGRAMNKAKDCFPVDYVTGADFFVRRSVLDKVGLFDENYFAYYEENDLSRRIAMNGYRSAIVPAASIVHLEGKSCSNPVRRKKMMYESSLYYLKKFSGRSPLFKWYCLINELKYRIYRFFSSPANAPLWGEMIAVSNRYRTKRVEPEPGRSLKNSVTTASCRDRTS